MMDIKNIHNALARLSIIFFVLCIIPVARAQLIPYNFSRISAGDQVPTNLPFANLVNYPNDRAVLSDFKGKWLILDYWFTGCQPCIQSWPRLMALQQKYGDRIQIVAVNHMQGKDIVEAFIQAQNKNNPVRFTLPSVTGDTILYKIFPPVGYPSIIWINPQGVYKATTSGPDLNDKTIQEVLNGNELQTVVDNTSIINLRRPLFIDGNGGSGQQMLWYSTVSKYSDKVKDGYFFMCADSSGYVIAATHTPIIGMIERAWGQGPFKKDLVSEIRLPLTRIDLRLQNANRLMGFVDGARVKEDLYTYQLISYSPRTLEELRKIMRGDLKKYFGLDFSWEKQKKKCLVLSADDTKLLGDNIEKREKFAFNKAGTMYIRDVPVYSFLGYLTEYVGGIYNTLKGYPLIDETGYTGGLDLVFENTNTHNEDEVLADYNKLNRALSRYKLHFSLQDREIDVLVVKATKEIKDEF